MTIEKQSVGGLGLILKSPSENSPIFAAQSLGTLPKTKKIWQPADAMNQMQTNACVGFTGIGFVMSEPMPKKLDDPEKLAVALYHLAQDRDGIPGREPDYFGTTLEGGCKALLEMGLAEGEFIWGNQLEQIIPHLLNRGPVMVGTEWTFNMAVTRRGRTTAKGTSFGGHAYLLYGADTVERELYFLNSHGRNYGVDGKFFMSFDEFDILLKRGGYACSISKF